VFAQRGTNAIDVKNHDRPPTGGTREEPDQTLDQTNIPVAQKHMTEASIRQLLLSLPPRASIAVEWSFSGETKVYRWEGWIYEGRGRRPADRVWDTEYRWRDASDGRLVITKSQLPRALRYRDSDVTVRAVVAVDGPVLRVMEQPEPQQRPTTLQPTLPTYGESLAYDAARVGPHLSLTPSPEPRRPEERLNDRLSQVSTHDTSSTEVQLWQTSQVSTQDIPQTQEQIIGTQTTSDSAVTPMERSGQKGPPRSTKRTGTTPKPPLGDTSQVPKAATTGQPNASREKRQAEFIDVDAETGEIANMNTELQVATEYYSLAMTDSQPGRLVHGALLDLILRRLYDSASAKSKEKWTIFSVAPVEPPRSEGLRCWMKPLWYEEHFVLLVYEDGLLTVHDSEPTYARVARERAVKLVGRDRPFEVVNTGPQRLNDCAFHTAKTAAKLLGTPVPIPITDIRGYFMQPIINDMKERRDELARLALPTYGEHVQRQRLPHTQQQWTPPSTLYEPSPPRPNQSTVAQQSEPVVDTKDQRSAVTDVGIFKDLQRRISAKPLNLLDEGDKHEVFAVEDDEVEEEMVMQAYPVTAEAAVELGLATARTTVGTFSELRKLVLQPKSSPHPLAQRALAATTRDEHERVLEIVRTAPAEYDGTPCATALLELFARTRQRRHWKWATLSKKLASVQGALRILPLYVRAEPVMLGEMPEWRQGVKYAVTRTKEEAPRAVRPMTAAQAVAAVERTADVEVKAAIALSWLVAARVGDILLLNGDDYAYEAPTVTLTYRRGKTISKRGPFSVHCEVPPQWQPLMMQLQQRAKEHKNGRLVKCTVTKVTKALRVVERQLESRSLRRGALQTMAAAGVDEEDLRAFSGHTTIAMLHRYLAWGAIGTKRKTQMGKASRKLWNDPQGAGIPVGGADETHAHHVAEEERMPRFLRHLGQEAPEMAEFWRFLGQKDERKQAHKLPLHFKDVIGSLNWRKVLEIEMPSELKEYVVETTRWLHDERLYERLMEHAGRTNGQGQVKWSENDVDRFITARKIEVGEVPKGDVGGARAFSTPEWEKERRRALWESFINDKIHQVPTIRFMTREERHRIISGSKYASLHDFSAFYDQISMDDCVRKYHGTRWKDKWIQPTVLPMGFRPACAVAQSLTWGIVEGLTAGTNCTIITYIDNIGIFGTDATEVELVSKRLVQRCSEVGAKLNDQKVVVETAFDFLGVHYDLDTTTRQCTDKTHKKIVAVCEYLRDRLKVKTRSVDLHLSKREVAAVMGVSLYASQTLSYNLCDVYWPMRYWRETSVVTHWDQWEEPAPEMRRNTLCALVAWLNALAKNAPVPILSKELGPEDAILFVDASADGYGVVAVTATGTQVAGGRWTSAITQSTTAEPRGAWLGLCRFVQPSWRSVIVASDHEPLVLSGQAQYAKSYEYNELFRRIRATFPALSVKFVFIPGKENPGDEPSRNKILDGAKLEAAINKVKGKRENGVTGVAEWQATAHNPIRSRVGG